MTPRHHPAPSSRLNPLFWAYALCLAFWILSIGTFWRPLQVLLSLSLHDNRYSHLVVIPLISACLIYRSRREIFRPSAYDLRLGIPLVVAGLGSGWWISAWIQPYRYNFRLALFVLAVLFSCAAGLVLFFGIRGLRSAKFPLLFLLLMIPIPRVLMDKIIFILQVGTGQLLYFLFRLGGTALYRHGFTFELPGIGIVVSEECTSIHAVWALVIISLLVGHFALRSSLAKTCLTLLTVPIAILTSAIRLLTLWFLTTHVSIDFLYGTLHRHGGMLFSLISLCNLLLCLWMLHRLEYSAARARQRNGAAASEPALSRMLSNWGELASLSNFSCELSSGKSISYQRADGAPVPLVGVVERAGNEQQKSLRVFVPVADCSASPECGDTVTVDQTAYTVFQVEREPEHGAWLSLRTVE